MWSISRRIIEMGAIFSPTHQLLVLSLVLFVINPAKIGASKKLTIRKLEKFNEDSDEVHSHLRIAEDEENLLKVSGKLNTHVDIDNHWKVKQHGISSLPKSQ